MAAPWQEGRKEPQHSAASQIYFQASLWMERLLVNTPGLFQKRFGARGKTGAESGGPGQDRGELFNKLGKHNLLNKSLFFANVSSGSPNFLTSCGSATC